MAKLFVYRFGTLLDRIDFEQLHAVITEAHMESLLFMILQVFNKYLIKN